MAWRNTDIDRLLIGYLIARGNAAEGAQLPAPASGASEATMPADTDVSGHTPGDQHPVRIGRCWGKPGEQRETHGGRFVRDPSSSG